MPKVDLSNCDKEPIHIPGSIQAHAVMLVLEEPGWRIVQASANATEELGDGRPVTGRALEEFTPTGTVLAWKDAIENSSIDLTPHYLTGLPAHDGGPPFEVLIHRNETGRLILELERWVSKDVLTSPPTYVQLQHTLKALADSLSLQTFCHRAAEHVRRFIGFDRVMVYRFAADGSGHVLAEDRRPDLESYLGLHYPASDIPAQARELFRRSPLRLNPDINYRPVPLDRSIDPNHRSPLDMSHCVTRSMSPIHVEYLNNMGVAASMSLSIVVDGRLWGLFACHHYRPRYVTHAARMATEFLASMLSLQIADRERGDHAHYAEMLRSACKDMELWLSTADDVAHTVIHPDTKPGGINACGCALLLAGEVYRSGQCPAPELVQKLGDWLSEHGDESVMATDRLAAWGEDIGARAAPISGVLAARLCRQPKAYLLWFRLSEVRTVNWAGDPNKAVTTGPHGNRLTPRTSFALWKEEMRDRAPPWLEVERDAARDLRHIVLEAMARQTERLVRQQIELENRNQDLESFAYIASHDLKEPLRGLRNYARYLTEDHEAEFSLEAKNKVATIDRLSARMEQLLDALLHYSRAGRADMKRETVDLNHVIENVREQVCARIKEHAITITLPRPLPQIQGDAVLITEVFTNLVSNAIKYNDKTERLVEIGWEHPAGAPRQFYVRDNGIGIPAEFQDTIFRIFKRLHGREEFGGGTGAGLTIVRAILTRLGGHIWVDSIPGEGSVFSFTLESDPTKTPPEVSAPSA
jgi:light-regulated signal transduction histidine kinase (bacteriophytochrome)